MKKTSAGVVSVLNFSDYYPYGEQLAGRNTQSDYRYAFQGQELDKETGMEAFQLRLWDGRIGRWLSKDPKGQYASPYLGMGNNPVSRIDPDGGSVLNDYYINLDGTINVVKTNDNFDRFFTATPDYSTDGVFGQLFTLSGKFDKNTVGLINFPDRGVGFTSYGAVETGGLSSGIKNKISFKENVGYGDSYLKPQAVAALLGVINELNSKGIIISLGDMSSSNGSDPANGGVGTFHHGGHGHTGKRSGLDIDFRYIGNDGNSFRGEMDNNKFNLGNNKSVYDAAFRFGFDPKNTYQGKKGNIPGVKKMGGHNNHGHLGLMLNPTNFKYN
jgi:RHS repeat-associated protein